MVCDGIRFVILKVYFIPKFQTMPDWNVIKDTYVYGEHIDGRHYFPTLKELSDAHDIPLSTMKYRSANESWSSAKEIFKSRLAKNGRPDIDTITSKVDSQNIERIKKIGQTVDNYLNELSGNERVATIREIELTLKSIELIHKLSRNIVYEPINYVETVKDRDKADANKKDKPLDADEVKAFIESVRNRSDDDD